MKEEEIYDFIQSLDCYVERLNGKDVFLQHHGILGQKWGVRRYQPYSTVPRKSGKGGKFLGRSKEKKAQAEKEDVLNSGSAREVYAIKDKLSIEEMRFAKTRLELERDISRLSNEEKAAQKVKVDKVFNTVDTVRNYTEKSINAYNTFAKVSNSIAGTKLPKISEEKAFSNNANHSGSKKSAQDAIASLNEKKARAQKNYEKAIKSKNVDLQDAADAYREEMDQAYKDFNQRVAETNNLFKMENRAAGAGDK